VAGEAQTAAIVNYREDLQRRIARKGAFLCGNKNATLH
jgi:hypothetical protein